MDKKIFKKIGVASDHAGYEMKGSVIRYLTSQGYEVTDFGCHSAGSCDYPDFAHPLAQAVSSGGCDCGISLCGSGNGINMVVNKYPLIRSALCWNTEIARLARQHNDANILALPARFLTPSEAEAIIGEFLGHGFDGGRHTARINKIPIGS